MTTIRSLPRSGKPLFRATAKQLCVVGVLVAVILWMLFGSGDAGGLQSPVIDESLITALKVQGETGTSLISTTREHYVIHHESTTGLMQTTAKREPTSTTAKDVSVTPPMTNTTADVQENDSNKSLDPVVANSQGRHRPFVNVSANDSIMDRKWKSPVVIEKYKLIFFTIQKNGCTVWKQLFRKMSGYKDWRRKQSFALRDSGLQTLRNFSLEQATHMMNSPDWTRAIMLRDPKDRFVSAYLDKALQTDYVVKFCCLKKLKKNQKLLNQRPQCLNQTNTFEGFVNITRWCEDGHWQPQSQRTEAKYFEVLDFVGHLETAAVDAERLLRHIGAWEEHGQTGWGMFANESIFSSTSHVKHKTSSGNTLLDLQTLRKKRLSKYFTPALERRFEIRYAQDYTIPQFNFSLARIYNLDNGVDTTT